MAGLLERWRTLPRAQQLGVALLLFWAAYVCAAAYEWSFGPPGVALPALDTSWQQPAGVSATATQPDAPGAASLPSVDDGFPIGDLAVVLAGAFMIIGLGIAVVMLWRESRGPVRQPGMGLGDDPLWSGGDLDL